MDSDDSEYEDDQEKDAEATDVEHCGKRKRPRRGVPQVNYSKEKKDTFFNGVRGYTNFNRTRKGGDVRPNAKEVGVKLFST